MGLWNERIRLLLCFSFLLWEGFLDRKSQKISLLPVAIAFFAGVLLGIFRGREAFIDAFAGASIGGAVMILAFLSRNQIGYGDGLILTASGTLLGFRLNVAMFLFGLFLAALRGAWLIILKKADGKTKMAFVPFLIPALTLSIALVRGGIT